MNLVKLGKKGQVSLPQALLRRLGLAPDAPLLVEAREDGAIVLRQVSIHPVEIYGDDRLREFAREDALDADTQARHAALLERFNRRLDRRTGPPDGADMKPAVDASGLPSARPRSTGAGRRR